MDTVYTKGKTGFVITEETPKMQALGVPFPFAQVVCVANSLEDSEIRHGIAMKAQFQTPLIW